MTPTITYYVLEEASFFRFAFEIDGHPHGRWLGDIRREMLEWVIASHMDYSATPDGSTIVFTSERDAAIFKLRWMGGHDA